MAEEAQLTPTIEEQLAAAQAEVSRLSGIIGEEPGRTAAAVSAALAPVQSQLAAVTATRDQYRDALAVKTAGLDAANAALGKYQAQAAAMAPMMAGISAAFATELSASFADAAKPLRTEQDRQESVRRLVGTVTRIGTLVAAAMAGQLATISPTNAE